MNQTIIMNGANILKLAVAELAVESSTTISLPLYAYIQQPTRQNNDDENECAAMIIIIIIFPKRKPERAQSGSPAHMMLEVGDIHKHVSWENLTREGSAPM